MNRAGAGMEFDVSSALGKLRDSWDETGCVAADLHHAKGPCDICTRSMAL